MKKFATLLVALVASVSTFAQVEKGTFTLQPMVGLDVTSLSGNGTNSEGLHPITYKSKLGFVGGVEGAYQFTDRFGLSVGVLYAMGGAKIGTEQPITGSDGVTIDPKLSASSLNVPVLANVYVWKGLALKAGIQPQFLLSANVTNMDEYNGKQLKSGEKDLMEYCNSVFLSVPVGASYDFPFGLTVDARYNIGVTNVRKDDDSKIVGKHNMFQITVGYKFHL